jgi:hypothetical protein
VVGGEVVGGCDDCSGDLMFSYHFENDLDITQGTPCGCVDAGGDTTATASGTATFDASIKSDGSYAGDYLDNQDYHDFTSATVQNFNDEEGKIVFDIYITTFVNGADILYIDNGTDYLLLDMTNTSTDIRIRAQWHANGADDYITTTTTGDHDEGEWARVTYQWKQSASALDHDVTVCDLTLPDTTSNCDSAGVQDNIADWTSGDATGFQIGVVSNHAADAHIDNLEVFATSGL